MAQKPDPYARSVHGTNPQNLIEQIIRNRIYNSPFWKDECMGLTIETLIDKAMELKHFGGTYGGTKKPTKFLCLIMKMLQLTPDKDIVFELINNDDYKYVRLLGAFYLRLIGKPQEVYQYLEPLYADFRRVKKRTDSGFVILHVDEVIDDMLRETHFCDVALPHLPKRYLLESKGLLPGPRKSILADEFEEQLKKEAEERRAKQAEAARNERDNPSRPAKRQRTEPSAAPMEVERGGERAHWDSYDSHRHSKDHQERERDRDRHADRRREKPDDKDERVGGGGSSGVPARGSAEWRAEIAEANALRAKLGLPPLKE